MDWQKRHGINVWKFSRTKSLGTRVKVELDVCNYETKVDFKNATSVDTSKFAKSLI